MKHVFMILVLLGGFALSESAAQANCKPANCQPCPPGCCIANCCTANSSAASVASQPAEIAFASLMIEDVSNDEKACKMSRKEMKACMTACKNQNAISVSSKCKTTTPCSTSSVAVKSDQKQIQKL